MANTVASNRKIRGKGMRQSRRVISPIVSITVKLSAGQHMLFAKFANGDKIDIDLSRMTKRDRAEAVDALRSLPRT